MFRHDARPALAALAAGLALALGYMATPATAAEAAPAGEQDGTGADAAAAPKVNINEYIVRGNSVLDARAIERAVTPYLGPGRSMADVEAARAALQSAYQQQGF